MPPYHKTAEGLPTASHLNDTFVDHISILKPLATCACFRSGGSECLLRILGDRQCVICQCVMWHIEYEHDMCLFPEVSFIPRLLFTNTYPPPPLLAQAAPCLA